MTSGSEPEHLDSRHRDTLRQIFQHPTSHNIEWRAVRSLLEAVGTVTVRHDGKVAVEIGLEKEVLDPPRGKDIDTQMAMGLRRMLSTAGYSPPGRALFRPRYAPGGVASARDMATRSVPSRCWALPSQPHPPADQAVG